jgi:acetylornithine deacetylase
MNYSIDREYLVKTLQEMVQINSVNPGLSPGGAGEQEMAETMGEQMRALGMEVSVYELAPKYWNAVGVLKGSGAGRSLMLTGHMDTVGVGDMQEPFSGAVRGDRLYGRGSCDMKCGLAAILGAVKALRDAGLQPAGDLYVAGAADEEYLSCGSEQLAKAYHVDGVVVAEPSGFTIVRAHKGFIWFEVKTFGAAVHGSNYEDGVDAITRMGRFLVELEKLATSQQSSQPYPLLGPPSLHASLIEGGIELSTYPPSCTLKIEWRTVPGQTEEQLYGLLQAIIDRLKAQDASYQAEVKTMFVRHPFQVSEDAPIVRSVYNQVQKVLGKAPEFIGGAGWADTSLFERAGMDALMFGSDGDGAHANEEWADLDALEITAQVFAETILDFCGPAVMAGR